MYECVICTYSTHKKSNIDKHLTTIKHMINLKNNKSCSICNKEFSTFGNYKRHMILIHKQNFDRHGIIKNNNKDIDIDIDIIDMDNPNDNQNNPNNKIELVPIKKVKNKNKVEQVVNEVKEDIKKEIKKSNIVIKKEIQKSNNEIKQSNNEVKEEVKEVKKVVTKAIHKASSLIKYLMEHHKSTPPLQKINNEQCINFLKTHFKCQNRDDKKYYLEEKFVSDFSGNKFVENISKCILSIVHVDDPTKQPIWNSDCSRLHYVVKTSLNMWNEDKSGIKFTDFVIKPMLKSICDRITNYRKEFIEKIDIKKYSLENFTDHHKLLSNVYGLEYALIRNDFIKPILKELAPHLRYIKKELDELENEEKQQLIELENEEKQQQLIELEMDNDENTEINSDNIDDEMEELEHIQEELKEIAENNGFDLSSEYNSDDE